MYELTGLFRDAYYRAATLATAEGAFRGSGIWPIDPLRFPEHEYAAADALNSDCEDEVAVHPVVNEVCAEIDPVTIEVNTEVDPVINELVVEEEIDNTQSMITTSHEPQEDPPCEDTPSKSSHIETVIRKISPIPEAKKGANGRKCGCEKQDAELLTSSPYKDKLVLSQRKKEETERRKKENEAKRS